MLKLEKLNPWNWFKKEEEQQQQASRAPAALARAAGAPVHPVLQLHREMDRLFDSFLNSWPWLPARDLAWPGGLLMPRLDISEGEKEYLVDVELPGVDRKDVELTVQDGVLVVRGEKRQEVEEHKRDYHRVERSYGSFQRVLDLPEDADVNDVQARFRDGVLRVRIGRKAPANGRAEGRRIEVQ